jgi:hypothetical protein
MAICFAASLMVCPVVRADGMTVEPPVGQPVNPGGSVDVGGAYDLLLLVTYVI